jgi:hypothetical protein
VKDNLYFQKYKLFLQLQQGILLLFNSFMLIHYFVPIQDKCHQWACVLYLQNMTFSQYIVRKNNLPHIIDKLNESISGKKGLIFCECVSLWARARRRIPIIFHPCQLKYSLTGFDDMSKYTLTKVYSYHVNNNSHVITATWIFHMGIQQ